MLHETAALALTLILRTGATQPVALPAEPATSEPAASEPAASEPEPASPAAPSGPAVLDPTPDPTMDPNTGVPLAAGPVAPPAVDLGRTPSDLRPDPPPYDGRGLLIGAGVLGLANVGLVAARLGLSLGEPTVAHEQTRLMLTAVATPIDLAAGIGLAAGGGYLRGRSDGYRSALDGAPKLRATAFTSSGVILLVMGAIGWASAWTPWHGDASLDARGGGSLVVESVGSLLLMGGSGLVAYGVSWDRHTRLYSRTRPLGVRPTLAPGFVGLALAGRF